VIQPGSARTLQCSPVEYRNAGAVILSVAYGWKVTSNDDYFVRLNEEAFSIHNLIKKPSGWLVEFFPLR
jgi:hypothetical protein